MNIHEQLWSVSAMGRGALQPSSILHDGIEGDRQSGIDLGSKGILSPLVEKIAKDSLATIQLREYLGNFQADPKIRLSGINSEHFSGYVEGLGILMQEVGLDSNRLGRYSDTKSLATFEYTLIGFVNGINYSYPSTGSTNNDHTDIYSDYIYLYDNIKSQRLGGYRLGFAVATAAKFGLILSEPDIPVTDGQRSAFMVGLQGQCLQIPEDSDFKTGNFSEGPDPDIKRLYETGLRAWLAEQGLNPAYYKALYRPEGLAAFRRVIKNPDSDHKPPERTGAFSLVPSEEDRSALAWNMGLNAGLAALAELRRKQAGE